MLNKIISSVVLIAILAAGSVNAQVTYIHEDFQGSVAAESNSIGQITKRVHYEPYGEQRTAPLSNEAAHTGHIYDADIGLSYMGSRYYDPTIGRFYSDDPVGFLSDNPASFNRYAYANNNPYAYKDPNGELPVFLIPVIVAIAKEVAASAAESYIESKTGVAVPLSTKSLVKGAAKQIGKKATQEAAEATAKQVAKGSAHGARAGKKHTRASIKEAKKRNADKNNGDVLCETCGVKTTSTTPRTKGSKVNPKEGQGDHIHPKSQGGNGATVKDQSNIDIKCASCNNVKSDRIE